MHELGLIQEVLAIVSEESHGARVRRIVLEVGAFTAVLPEALRFAFELAREGTVAEGAELEIVETRGRGRCRGCGEEFDLELGLARCRCGGTDVEVRSGDELKVREMEIA
jgi:hydrogenase nickel incorporation protein HypA/HybF